MPKLVCQSGPNAGHEFTITKDLVVLGRQSSCDVQIVDSMASRAHCHIRRDGKLWSLVDLGSRNGTLLEGRPLPPYHPEAAWPGANIQLGDMVLQLLE